MLGTYSKILIKPLIKTNKMVGTKNSGNRSGKRITKWEKAHGHEAGTEKSCPETIKLANAWNKARVQKTKTDAAEEHRKLYGPKPITVTERATLSLDVARIATKNVPQRQGTLRLSVCAGNNIWTEVASKRKANADVGGEPEKKSSRHQKAALAKSEKNNKGNPTCRCRQEYHPELFRHANLRKKTNDGTPFYGCANRTKGGGGCGFFQLKSAWDASRPLTTLGPLHARRPLLPLVFFS